MKDLFEIIAELPPEHRLGRHPVLYVTVPCPHMASAVARYVEFGLIPGDFLQAFLRNDLFEAVGRADAQNQANIVEWVRWFHNQVPTSCYGSVANIKQWVDLRKAARKHYIKAQRQ